MPEVKWIRCGICVVDSIFSLAQDHAGNEQSRLLRHFLSVNGGWAQVRWKLGLAVWL